MSENKTTMTTLATALETLAGVLRELATTPVPSTPESSSVSRSKAIEKKYAKSSTLAPYYDLSTRQMDYILARAGKNIRRLEGVGRGTLYNTEDVEKYLTNNRK